MFVGVSFSPTLISVCYAIHPDDLSTHSATFTPPNSSNQMWGAASTSALYIDGDQYYNGVIGEIADGRYYFTSALSVVEMEGLFQTQKASFGVGCAYMTSVFKCFSCHSGYFLDGASQCQLCNACCLSCTGPGNMSCSGCAPPCQLEAGVCISKR